MMYFYVKRAFDVFFSILLLLLLLPVFIIISMAIFLQDGHRVIFKQIRVGVDGEIFLFYKFRSMPVNTPNVESHEVHKLKVTRIGKFIRRTNLDELPQLFNILTGDMSFVGPRPPIESQKELIQLRFKNGSIKVRPGLTGLAQINAFDNMSTKEKASFDGLYVSTISLKTDIVILFKTVGYLFKTPPTY